MARGTYCTGNRDLPNRLLKDLIIDGIIGGVGGVIVFLPNILLLYFFISFMEDLRLHGTCGLYHG